MVFEGELAVKLHDKDVEVETRATGTPDKTKSPRGGFTVLDLLTIKTIIFLALVSSTSNFTTPEY